MVNKSENNKNTLQDQQDLYISRLIKIFILVALVTSGFLSSVTFLSAWEATFRITFTIFILNIFAMGLLIKRKQSIAILFSLTAILLGGTYAIATGEGLRDMALLLFPAVIILSSILFSRKIFIFFSTASIIIVNLVGFAQITGLIINPESLVIEGIDLVVITAILLGIAIVIRQISLYFQKSLEELKKNENALSQSVDALRKQSTVLQDSEARWRSLVENAPDIIMNVELDGNILFANKLVTIDKPGKERFNIFDFIDDEHHKIMKDTLNTVFKKNKNAICELQLISGQGKSEWYSNHLSPVYQNDRVISAIMISSNISIRKKAEQALANSEEKYKHIFENVQDIYCELDFDGTVLEISPALEYITSYTRQDLIGKPVFDLVANDVQSKKFVNTIQKEGKVTNFEVALKDKGGEVRDFALNSTIVPDKSTGHKKIVISLRDMTERKKLMGQLLQAQKMDSIGTLAGGIAHDFNNLLTVINGHSQLAETKLAPDDPLNEDIQAILTAGDRAAALTRQILAFSRKQIVNLETIDLNEIVHDMNQMINRLIGENIILKTNLEENIGAITADRGQIEQVLINLVINARDAINAYDKGTKERVILIETSRAILEDKFDQHILSGKIGPQTVLVVSDTGIGMNKETQKYIFEPFFTTKETGEGTGLGLAMVYGIVKQNEGSIYIYSEPQKGTSMKIYWPISVKRPGKLISQDEPEKEVRGNEKILLVEDDEGVRHFAVKALESYGYKIIDLPNGPATINYIEKNNFHFDLLVTDIVMPKMSGDEMVTKLNNMLKKKIKVIYTSGYTDTHIDIEQRNNRDFHFLNKPYSTRELARKVREVLDN